MAIQHYRDRLPALATLLPVMQALRRHPALAWIAILAVLAMALLPTVTHAMTHLRGDSITWVEVCTPQGMRLVSLASSEPAPADPAPLQTAGHLEHCPLCTLSQHLPALPAADAPAVLLPTEAQALPWLFLHAPHTLHAWRSAQPRGPPVLLP
jgi:hypothetical protein